LFPFIKATNTRLCDPNTDRYKIGLYRNRIIFSIADGFREGHKGVRAAEIATRVVIETLQEQQLLISDVRQAGREILGVISAAHEAILQGTAKWSDCGTASLLAGILIEVDLQPGVLNRKSPRTKKRRSWTLMVASVGNCKAYHFSVKQRRVIEITSRSNLSRYVTIRSDPGGRVGPFLEDGCPDLRNFHLYICQCMEEDMIFLVSNGVSENFDPEYLGLSPRDISGIAVSSSAQFLQKLSKVANPSDPVTNGTNPQNSSSFAGNLSATTSSILNNLSTAHMDTMACELPQFWEEMEPIARIALKSKYTVNTLAQVINESGVTPMTPNAIVKCLLDHCLHITKTRRKYLKKFPKRVPPRDHFAFPGVLDHATCVCFEVKRGPRPT